MKTAAVIVTYNPDKGFTLRLKAIARECDAVFVIDNGSESASLKALRSAAKKTKAKLIELGENTGIAHAQNVGMERAFKSKADGVILFDHDSTPQKNFSATLWSTYAQYKNPVIVGAQVFDINTRHFSKYPIYAGPVFRRRLCPRSATLSNAMLAIASGTLISRGVYQHVGTMREEFFIDYVDWEYCLRARYKFAVETIICGDAILEHARGERKGRRILGITMRPPGYSLMRYRHIYRNRAVLVREYFFRAPAFLLFEIVACTRDTLLIFFEERAPIKFLSAAWNWLKGFFAGIRA